MSKTPTVIHWFRLDLRIHDNLALRNAINEAENRKHLLRPIYFLDPNIKDKVGINRLRFLLQSLEDLDNNLKKLNTCLYVLRGKAVDLLPKLFDDWQVKYLTCQVDIDPEFVQQDEYIEDIAEKKGVFINKRVQHTVYDVHKVLRENNGAVPLTYQKFLSLVKSINVKEPIEISNVLSSHCKPIDIQSENYSIPNLKELQIDEETLAPVKYHGGETEALKRLNLYMSKKEWVCKFEKPNSSPNSIEPSTTVLSPYISHGCLSAKLFYHKLKEVENGRQHTLPPVSLMGQLMWREFYYTAGTGVANFDKMVGNAICIQIPWTKNDAFLKAWAEGKTGYPFVDAIMRQLKQEGWIHHLARHMVACFLTRGDLWISWEEGAKIFEDYLLDYDWSLNAGNWMWLSASAFFYKYFRVYSPVAFGQKTDKEGVYIKKYVPELKKYPREYIYEPWKAPQSIQRNAGCIIGEHYPKRIVNHDTIHKENIQKMSTAYKLNREKKAVKRPRS
ncbi:cryptochrome-1 [Bombyx mandarina]|uniref:Cryptochrome-1 n=1 Tax=Bombyx mandarina TaxID=7092 RepID=A0A6J2KLI3_BOMMA|nr:cryptochrome-1 [Bombyx mandarina]